MEGGTAETQLPPTSDCRAVAQRLPLPKECNCPDARQCRHGIRCRVTRHPPPPSPPPRRHWAQVLGRIFRQLDGDGSGAIDLREFVSGLCACLGPGDDGQPGGGGARQQQLGFVHSLFAAPGDGSLDRTALVQLVGSLWSAADVTKVPPPEPQD